MSGSDYSGASLALPAERQSFFHKLCVTFHEKHGLHYRPSRGKASRPLVIDYATKVIWPLLKARIPGLKASGAAIIADLCRDDGWVSYARGKMPYLQKIKRYQNSMFTFDQIVPQVDYLDRLGLIDHDRALCDDRGWRSAARANDRLRAIFAEVAPDGVQRIAPRETIILRNERGEPVDYRETREISRMRNRLTKINLALLNSDIQPASLKAPMRRIFNGNFKSGGRFFAEGSSWQNIPSEERLAIKIDGEAVAEVDYKSMHPAILYGLAGAKIPDDCYAIDGWPRNLVKKALLTIINAGTFQEAAGALAHDPELSQFWPVGVPAIRSACHLIAAIKKAHQPIAAHFHSGAGVRLMRIESDMAERVMLRCLERGVVTLPIHDSLLAKQSASGVLRDIMEAAALDAGLQLRAETKPSLLERFRRAFVKFLVGRHRKSAGVLAHVSRRDIEPYAVSEHRVDAGI